MNAVTPRTTAEMAVKAPVPTKLYAEGGKLFVHTGASFRVVGQLGDLGKMTVSGSYPENAFPAKTMDWLHDTAGVAQYVATAVNSYPVLTRRVRSAEAMTAEMAAKLAVAAEALKRGPLKPEYAASLARELEMCVAKYKG